MDHLEPYPEYEDDVYFAEIRRQIMILTADDDEDCPAEIRHCKPVTSLGINNDDGDDVFYDDLRRQILLLTVEDNEDFLQTRNSKSFNGSSGNFSSFLQHGNNSRCWETEHAHAAPASLVNQWGYGNGTGVFIPHIVKSRTRNKSGKKKKTRSRKRVEDKEP